MKKISKNEKRKIFSIVTLSFIILILGIIALFISIHGWIYSGRVSASDFLISLFFLIVGVGGLIYARSGYQGGAPTIVGAIFTIFSLFFGMMALFYPSMREGDQLYYVLFYVFAFLLAGGVLMRSGHKYHLLKKKYKERDNS